MPRTLSFGPATLDPTAPGAPLAFEIDTPTRSDGARITLQRIPIGAAPGWPDGELFELRAFERDRGTGALHLLYSTRIWGGAVSHPVFGTNFPMQIGLEWPADRDKDLIRFEADVLQPFRTALTLEFL